MLYVSATLLIFTAWVCVPLTLVLLPGTWIAVFAAALVWWWTPELIGPWTVASVALLAACGELLEMISSAAGAKKVGGSRAAAWMSLLGSIVGLVAGTLLIPVPLIGSLIGAVIGAGVFALIGERGIAQQDWRQSIGVGRGAAVGRFTAVLAKTLIAVIIAIVLTVSSLVG